MTYPGLGGQQQPAVNAPAGQANQVGVAPGVPPARVIVIAGTGALLLAYSPTRGAGNLVASIAATQGTDQYGNAYPAGITSIDESTGLVANMSVGQLNITDTVADLEAGLAGTFIFEAAGQVELTSGKTVAADTPATLLLGSADSSGGTTHAAIFASSIELGSSAAPIPISSAGTTTVAQVVSLLKSVGIFS